MNRDKRNTEWSHSFDLMPWERDEEEFSSGFAPTLQEDSFNEQILFLDRWGNPLITTVGPGKMGFDPERIKR